MLGDPPAATGAVAEVSMKDLKAVFFVRDFKGHPQRTDRKHFADERPPVGREVEVAFHDGEVLVGHMSGYQAERPAFFLTPADPGSNNLRILVVARAVSSVKFL
jgi:hypothetical protein